MPQDILIRQYGDSSIWRSGCLKNIKTNGEGKQTERLRRFKVKEQKIHDVRLVKEYYGKHDNGCCEAAVVVFIGA